MNVSTAWAAIAKAASTRLLDIALLFVVAVTGWISYVGAADMARPPHHAALGQTAAGPADGRAVDQRGGESRGELPKEYRGVRRAGIDYEPQLISPAHHPN